MKKQSSSFFITAFRSSRFFPNLSTPKAVFICVGQVRLAALGRYIKEILLSIKTALSALLGAMRLAKDIPECLGLAFLRMYDGNL